MKFSESDTTRNLTRTNVYSPKRRARVLLRALGWTILLGYLFFCAVVIATRLWIVPNVERYYPQVETYLEERLGTEIQTQSIKADWDGLRPRITLTQVTISRQGDEASLTLPKVEASFSFETVYKLRPTFSKLIIHDPELNIKRLDDSTFNIAGFLFQQSQNATPSGSRIAAVDRFLDWLLAQQHLQIVNGRISYTDLREQRPRPVQLTQANFVLHRYLIAWKMGFQALLAGQNRTPVDVRATIRESLFGGKNRIEKLYGTIYASTPDINFAHIARRINLDNVIHQGHGQTNIWLDFKKLRITSLTADIALNDVNIRISPEGQFVNFESLQGRILEKLDGDTLVFETKDLLVQARNSLPQILGKSKLTARLHDGKLYDGQFNIEFFDLQSISTLGLQLPIPPKALYAIQDLNAEGLVENFVSHWSGPITSPTDFGFEADFTGLSIQDHLANQDLPNNRPGFRNLSGRISANAKGGTLTLNSKSAVLSFPGIFFEKDFALDTLSMDAQWVMEPVLTFKVNKLSIANHDASALVYGSWTDTGDLGTLEIRGDLHYLRASSAHLFIPIAAGGKVTNDWLKYALTDGIATNGKVDLYGPLNQFPFHKSADPSFVFRITCNAENVRLDYMPEALRATSATAWPVIENINGTMVFDGMSMDIRAQSATSMGATITDVVAQIPSYTAVGIPLHLEGKSRAPLSTMAAWVNASPVSAMIGKAFEGSTASGEADLALTLDIPITKAKNTKVKGTVTLDGNALTIQSAPPLEAVTGTVRFTEKGIWSTDITGQVYGAPTTAVIDTDESGLIRINATTQASAQTISHLIDSPVVDSILTHVSGNSVLNTKVDIAKGVKVSVTGDMKGMSSDLPAPLKKSADEIWPVDFSLAPCTTTEQCKSQFKLSLHNVLGLHVQYRDSADGLKTQRGSIAVGHTKTKLPPVDGLAIDLKTEHMKWEQWRDTLATGMKAAQEDPKAHLRTLSLRAADIGFKEFDYGNLQFENLTLKAAANTDGRWEGSIASTGTNGRFSFTPAAANRHAELTADLDFLYIPSPEKVDEVLRLAPQTTESLPSVDLNVKDLRYNNYQLGALDVVAQNKGEGPNAYWDLTRFELTNDEMKLIATGRWNAGRGAHSKTSVEATADISDLGDVLDRFNLSQVINDGVGQVHAQLNWQGAPIDFNTKSLNGNVSVALASGQILQVEPGAGRLISLLSLQTLLRRLTLDFRDVVGQGFVFDTIVTNSAITNGMMQSNNFRLVGPQATVLGDGWLDLNSMTQNFTVTVLPDISLGSAALALTVANPILGVGSFLAQWALQTPLSQLFSVQYAITGTIDEPIITKIENTKANEQSLPSTTP